MDDTRLLVVFALLQIIMCLSILDEVSAATCHPSGFVHGKRHSCPRANSLYCCAAGKRYPQFRCSPPVSAHTSALLTATTFDEEVPLCDGRFHRNSDLVVTLSPGWLRLDDTNRCDSRIRISANGRSVLATVVDECDAEYGFEPPCRNNVVSGSPAVWRALGLHESIGMLKVTWTDDTHVHDEL